MSMQLTQAQKMYLRREWLTPYKEAREADLLRDFFAHLRKVYFEAFPLKFSPIEDPDLIEWTKDVVMKRVERVLFWMRTTAEPPHYREGILQGKQYQLAEMGLTGPPRKKPRVHSALDSDEPTTLASQTKRSGNGRTHLRKEHKIQRSGPTPSEWCLNNEVEGWDVEDSSNLVDLDCDLVPAAMRTRYASSDDPMADWLPRKQEFLNEFMRMEGQSEEARAGFYPARKEFHVLHVNGVHLVALDYCGCERRVPRRFQLFRAGWYPATVKYPATAATLELLKSFHGLSLCSKVSAHEYYLNLERLTDNSRVDVPKTRYKAFLRMIRQYRHMMLLKRGGRGNVEDGVENIGPGELALLCLACPQPGINLPVAWMSVAIAMSIDANFRLKNRLRNNDKDDGLHTGLAYFVEQKPYNEHILKHTTEADISNCSGFDALARADSRSTTGLRYTGVGMCVCSRHEMIRPLGVGDLQKGERYCNMDFIFLSAISGTILTMVMAIYDIACQWKVNLAARMPKLPAKLQLRPTVHLDFAIPKCHCPAHKLACQTPHSLNLKPGAGRTDGEGIERDWSMFNPAANSTKEMGMGSRHDTLDDLFGYHNWQKTAGLGVSLKRKYLIAAVESKRHAELHQEFCDSVPPATQREWTKMILEWERDNKKCNPYVPDTKYVSENDVKLTLLESERVEVAFGDGFSKGTATSFVSTGLVIEETQRRLQAVLSDKDLTSIQASHLQERRLNLTKQIKRFRSLQRHYIPHLDTLTEKENTLANEPESAALWLPSAIPAADRARLSPDIFEKETRLREGQCYDALERIRLTQRAKRHVMATKHKHAPGQRAGAKARVDFDHLQSKINQAAAKYRAARAALVSLVGEEGVSSDLRVLQASDIRPPPAFEPTPQPPKNPRQAATHLGEGYREVPWIWRMYPVSTEETNVALNQGLRIEWAKSRARSLRWTEELLLLKEEMRRVRVSLRFRADLWRDRAKPWKTQPSDPILVQGISAYAMRQADLYDRLLAHFTALWERPPHKRSALANVRPPGMEDAISIADESRMTDRLMEAREIDAEALDDNDDDDDDMMEEAQGIEDEDEDDE
ncbi:hypothetical protein ONZ45_g15534 [Pleurotus djamor]|nr:hypothetical protein ONZ45_g15534 [Pleurotus djamor]